MKASLTYNGTARVLLEPDDAIEEQILAKMATASENGTTTILAKPARNEKYFSLEVGGK